MSCCLCAAVVLSAIVTAAVFVAGAAGAAGVAGAAVAIVNGQCHRSCCRCTIFKVSNSIHFSGYHH